MTHPIDSTIIDGAQVSKTSVRGYMKARVPVIATAAEVTTFSLVPQELILIGARSYLYDAADTTSAHSPPAVVVSADGRRYKPAPFQSPVSATADRLLRVTDPNGSIGQTSRLSEASDGTVHVRPDATTIAGPEGTAMHARSPDGATTRYLADAFGATASFTFRAANGTAASPSALTSGRFIGALAAFGYGSTGYTASARANIIAVATENWTDAAQGTQWVIRTTANGTTTPTDRVTVNHDGRVEILGKDNTSSARATNQGSLTFNERNITSLEEKGGLEFKASIFGVGYGVKLVTYDDGTFVVGNRANAASWTERFRITQSGAVQVPGTFSASGITSVGTVVTGVFTVATLPAGVTGAMAYVTDANATTYNAIVAGGGSNRVRVSFDGTNWRIG